MNEREPIGPESLNNPERSQELEQAAAEALKKIERSAETVAENSAEKLRSAREIIDRQPEQPAAAKTEKETVKPPASRLDKAAAYWETMRALQRRLKPSSRNFSKFIHSPAVEKTSEVASKTVFRPSVTLGAVTTALIVSGFLYFTAYHYGFPLSGSTFWLSLLVGGIVGLVAEFIAKAVRPKK